MTKTAKCSDGKYSKEEMESWDILILFQSNEWYQYRVNLPLPPDCKVHGATIYVQYL